MREWTMLVTCIGGGLSAQFIRLLKASTRHRVRVIGVDGGTAPVARRFCDAFARVPHGDADGYCEAIAELCVRHGAELVFPGADEEALSLARDRARFDAMGVTVACNDLALLELFCDKVATYRRLDQLGIAMPVWSEVRGHAAVASEVETLVRATGGAVVKQPSARGGRGTLVIGEELGDIRAYDGSRELHMGLSAFSSCLAEHVPPDAPVMVMERLGEPAHDLDVLAWKGEPVHLVPRRRLHSALPNEGHVLVEDAAMTAIGRDIVRGLGASWLFDIDFMMTADGKPAVLEINPRASGSVAVAVAAGIPLVDDLLSLLAGEALEPLTPPFGTVVFPYTALATA